MKNRNWEYPYDLFIKSIAQKMRYTNDEKLKEYDLTSPQALLLELIEREIRHGNEITRKGLESVMNLKGSSITNLLNGLDRKGCIIRSTGISDGRTFQIQVTAKGKNILTEMEKVFEETEEQLLKGMSQEDKKVFLDLLIRAYKNLYGESD
ncbi:winged helix DNA-binding protein [Clostridium beijerinckii]|uniref:MarR family winged helix-turn-helix transcriptional regulator n=1 Tax=Clostridium beijerinckii TaxID=1520 RepID=UPI00149452E3|nr:winged helix DNA-binding protein [Clostridium beijerinckii]NOW05524.1 DNA-binding MarR family transcriptional regulator [Clostridium beijerinckii]NYC01332.1 DNA-binding MarR family transcriptional regulator [Clostridium beijerinckii]UYZ33765.1 winged helix DNA-binding protein [Clostridium beijerinckii]